GMGPLHFAAVRGELEKVRRLVAAGAALNAAEGTNHPSVLHMAAQGGHLKIVSFLIEQGASIDVVWPLNGHTPLLEATFSAHPSVAQFLLNNGADTGAVTVRGLTSSDLAAREADRNPNSREILSLLNEHNKKLGLNSDSSGKFDISSDE